MGRVLDGIRLSGMLRSENVLLYSSLSASTTLKLMNNMLCIKFCLTNMQIVCYIICIKCMF